MKEGEAVIAAAAAAAEQTKQRDFKQRHITLGTSIQQTVQRINGNEVYHRWHRSEEKRSTRLDVREAKTKVPYQQLCSGDLKPLPPR